MEIMEELPCILADKLYVPEAYVRPEHVAKFVYKVDDDDDTDYSIFEGYVEHFKKQRHRTIRYRELHTFSKMLDPETNINYYAFSRGNLPKIFDLYGGYEWEDRTAAPKMKYPLVFDSSKSLLTFEEHGRGQKEAIEEWLKYKYGIIRAAPRFGKSVSGIFIATKLGLKTLIVAHQIDLLWQFYKAFDAFTNVNEIREKHKVKINYSHNNQKVYFPKSAKGMVVGFFNEHEDPEELDVCLLSWQKFASKYGPERLEKFRDTWGLNITDECHRSASLKYAGVINKLNPRYRLGLTGTVERCDGQEFIIKDIIGPVTAEGQVRQLPCKVTIIKTGFFLKTRPEEPLPFIYKRLYNDKARTSMILSYLEKDYNAGHYICVAFHSGSQKQLVEFTDRLNFEGIKAESFYGASRNRDKVLERAISGETRVLVCNQRMLTGIDIPCWDVFYNMFPSGNVVFNTEGKLSGNHYQNFSRIRTPFTYPDGKEKISGKIRDFLDEGGFAQGTYKKREKAYKNQGFEIEFIRKPINL